MIRIIFASILLTLCFVSCSKNKPETTIIEEKNPYTIYKNGLEAFNKNDYFFAQKKFLEAELIFDDLQLAAKSATMATYALYSINFYNQALENIDRILKIYPSDKNIIYIHYLKALIYYEQISDEKRDIDPLLKTNEQIDFFLKEYPNSDYAIDLKFKKDLIRNQLAAKEVFVAKYYISTQKWIPAINRLKIILSDYDDTVFIEEALHRLVEIHYHIGLEDEAKKYANILGYNYNSSKWFEQSYKILNADYKIKKNTNTKKNKSFINNIIKMIK